jgi:hypothetical protein
MGADQAHRARARRAGRRVHLLAHLQVCLPRSQRLVLACMHGALADGRILLLAGMTVGSIVMQLFLLTNVLTVSRACLAVRDPIPAAPDTSLRVAFLTTIVPGKEPIEMAERTLRAAQEIVYGGKLDVWLLDEGDSSEVKDMCGRLGVRHFSRKDRGYLDFDAVGPVLLRAHRTAGREHSRRRRHLPLREPPPAVCHRQHDGHELRHDAVVHPPEGHGLHRPPTGRASRPSRR